MKRLPIVLTGLMILGVAIFWGKGTPPRDEAGAARPEVLEAEYALARGSNFYFVLDLGSRKMELKAKGMVMKSWDIIATKFWGRPDFPATIEISRKSALKAPKRFEIKPVTEDTIPESDPAEFELDALEVSDMPVGFTLHSAGGDRISIGAKKGSVGSLVAAAMSSLTWHMFIPSRHLVRTILGRRGFAIEILFRHREDSQTVYWMFFEGIKGIVY